MIELSVDFKAPNMTQWFKIVDLVCQGLEMATYDKHIKELKRYFNNEPNSTSIESQIAYVNYMDYGRISNPTQPQNTKHLEDLADFYYES